MVSVADQPGLCQVFSLHGTYDFWYYCLDFTILCSVTTAICEITSTYQTEQVGTISRHWSKLLSTSYKSAYSVRGGGGGGGRGAFF